MFSKQDANKRVEDLFSAVDFLKAHPDFSGHYGAILSGSPI